MNRVVERSVIAVALVAAAWAVRDYRRTFVRSLFRAGTPHDAAPRLPAGTDMRSLPEARRVRVVLIDGLDLSRARALPELDALCKRGIDMVVDVGFPTVSLPIQHVLWTGRTQQMSGVLFAARRIDPPPPDALPAHVPGSVGVSEAVVEPEVSGGSRRGGPYQFIVQSFGFSRVAPEAKGEAPAGWTRGGFRAAAITAAESDARLAFVHVLRADTAGHKSGRRSAQFRAATLWADELLGALIAADQRTHHRPARWFVLSDHGHTEVGGHGGAEPSIRQVRACIAGDLAPRAGDPAAVHLVDVYRALADSLGLTELAANKPGRPLYSALTAADSRGAALPTPGGAQWMLAAALMIVALLVSGWAADRSSWALPWWFAIACGSVLLLETTPSLSLTMVYAPRGQAIYLAALPGLCTLAVTGTLASRRLSAWRVTLAALSLPCAAATACRVLSGAIPPLMPRWTALTSGLLVITWCALLIVALVTAAAGLRGAPHA